MKTVLNLSNDDSYQFDDNVEDAHAVCQCYCVNNNLSSWFFSMVHNGMSYIDTLPLSIGDKSIACGDYTIIKELRS